MPATPKDNAGGHLLCHSGSYHARAPRLSGVSPEETPHSTRGDRELSQPQSCAQRCHVTTGSQRGNAPEAEGRPPAVRIPPGWGRGRLGVRIPTGNAPLKLSRLPTRAGVSF